MPVIEVPVLCFVGTYALQYNGLGTQKFKHFPEFRRRLSAPIKRCCGTTLAQDFGDVARLALLLFLHEPFGDKLNMEDFLF